MATAAPARPQPAPVHYAGFWIRVAAYLIDSAILGIPFVILFAVFGGGMAALVRPGDNASAASAAAVLGTMSTMVLVGYAIYFCYFIFLESSEKQATVGKMVLGLKVSDANGGRISVGRAAGRTFSKLLSGILCIGYIMVGLTEKKQGLHDMIAGTLVVSTK